MSKKLKIFLSITAILIGIYFINLALKDNVQEIKTNGGNEYKAKLIEYNNDEKFWFLVTNREDLIGSTITGLSSDGKIIEQITQ